MDEFFAIQVDGHIEELKRIQKEFQKVDTFPMSQVDLSNFGFAMRSLKRELEMFERFAESARREVAA